MRTAHSYNTVLPRLLAPETPAPPRGPRDSERGHAHQPLRRGWIQPGHLVGHWLAGSQRGPEKVKQKAIRYWKERTLAKKGNHHFRANRQSQGCRLKWGCWWPFLVSWTASSEGSCTQPLSHRTAISFPFLEKERFSPGDFPEEIQSKLYILRPGNQHYTCSC